MEFTTDIYKINPATGEILDDYLVPAGTRRWFDTKVLVNGIWYLRTEHDTDIGAVTGIPLSSLSEITPVFGPMLTPRWMELKYDTTKIDPITEKPVSDIIKAGTKIYFPTKFIIGDNTYLRTQHDTDANLNYGIKWSDLKDSALDYVDMVNPRTMKTSIDLYKLDIRTMKNIDEKILANQELNFNTKIYINNQWYLRTTDDTLNKLDKVISLKYLSEIN